MSSTSTIETTAQHHPEFTLLSQSHIASLQLDASLYQHKTTGAQHLHLASDSDENAFLVALRTVPTDSTGVAHILEHLALCGSKRYPVRDPFFMMLRRSLNTFMNAMTSSDWTAYPFATCNNKDFDNLLSVYLDAVFFSRLDPLDFAQEGHRVEFSETGSSDSDLVYKGVVFNEMKGAMSSITSTLWQTLSHHLFPTSTYHYNSGGEPADIPSLQYDDLLEFYRTHYHPGNAIFMTFGNIPAAQHQAAFEEQALQHFSAPTTSIAISPEQRLNSPTRATEHYAFDEGDPSNKTHVVMGWLLGETSNLVDALEAQLLSGVLLDNSASPLRKALEKSDIGTAPSPLCGTDDSSRELVFVCGLEGCDDNATEPFEQLVINTLQTVKTEGVPQQDIESVLHQLELHQREIGGDGYPYGLQLMMQGLGAFVHQGDIIETLDIEIALTTLRTNIQDKDYIAKLVDKYLLSNSHRVTLTLQPDTELSSKKNQAEQEQLANLKSSLNADQQQAIVEQAAKLEQRQNQVDDASILPKVGLADVPADMVDPTPIINTSTQPTITHYPVGTNGLIYQQAVFTLPKLSDEQLQLLPHYTNLLTELGLGENDYLAVQQRQAATVGSIHAFSSMRTNLADISQTHATLTLSAKALVSNSQAMGALLQDTLTSVRFDEHTRVRELIAQSRARREQSVVNSGHSFAMLAASADFSPLANHSNKTGGLPGLLALRELDDSLNDAEQLQGFCNALADLHSIIISAPMQLLNLAESDVITTAEQQLINDWQQWPQATSTSAFSFEDSTAQGNQVWQTNTQVNFCSMAFPTVGASHEDAAALTVLGVFLRNGYLHRAIREQGGAYGGGAGQESNYGVFRFFSYRDPRLAETLADFTAAIAWLQNNEHDSQSLEEAILGVIGSIDKTSSPAGKAKQHFYNVLFGRELAQRQLFREQVLNVSLADLKHVAATYLVDTDARTVVITNENGSNALADFIAEQNAQLHKL